jgi:putative ABC transport system permease protein
VRLLVVRDGVPLVGAGLAIGITSAWILIHAATSVLYGVTPADVPPYALGALVVALCSGAALWLPSRRASAVDPAIALRQD